MTCQKTLGKLCLAVALACSTGVTLAETLSAFQVNNNFDRPVLKEGNNDIMEAKATFPNAGSMVYFYWHNNGDAPRQVVNLHWNGKDYKQWDSADGDYQAIWHSFRPEKIAPGNVGEIALCLRTAFAQPIDFELEFDDGSRETVKVQPQNAPAHFATIAFSSDLLHARCFLEEQDGGIKTSNITVAGKKAEVAWWSDEALNGLRIAELTFEQALTPGERLIFLAMDNNGTAITGASLRAFSNLATFGTYGLGELRRYAENGLDSFNSFSVVSKDVLDNAKALNMRVITGPSDPEPNTAGHPGLYGYLLTDEPDCKDYGIRTERPLNRCIGGNAPEMLKRYNSVESGDPLKPAFLTIDLTFVPYNYFVYAPLADISNPDIYPNTCGCDLKLIDHHLNMMKRASAPRPFTFTYQSCWEEYNQYLDHWVGRQELIEKGFESFRDKNAKRRGFGYNTNQDEIAIAMHYALMNGATGLFAYTDSSETGIGLLFHGSDVLPENWEAVGRNSRKMARIGSLLCPAHPVTLAKSTGPVLAGTLLADRDHLLVVAINENYKCGTEAFTINDSETTITLPLPPWMEGKKVHRVGKNGFEPIAFHNDGKQLSWNAHVRNGEIYMVSSSDAAAQRVIDGDSEHDRIVNEAFLAEQKFREEQLAKQRLIREQYNTMRKQGDAFEGQPINGYYLQDDSYPAYDGPYNAIESWEQSGIKTMGAEWSIPVDATQTGRVHELLWHGRIFGIQAQIVLTAPDGSVVFDKAIDLNAGGDFIWKFTPQVAGNYKLRTISTPKEAVEHGNRIGRQLFRVLK